MDLNHVTTAFAGGFIFLLGWIMKLQSEVMQRPKNDWCEDHFASKDVISVKLDKIEGDVAEIKESIKTLAGNISE